MHSDQNRVVTWIYSKTFDLPFYTLVPYITERLMLETDFVNEANNAEKMASLVANEPRLSGRVYIPKVYRELSSKRIMTAEWIEGVRLWDKETLTASWQGGWRQGSPGAQGTRLSPPTATELSRHHSGSIDEHLKPERSAWKGPKGNGGLGVSLKTVMTTMVDLFSAQMFLWGWVHCDPHPGNLFVRRLPSGAPELVLIDHGLYIHMDPTFRQQYARFWTALLSFDNATLAATAHAWGVRDADMFASATLLRPYTGGDRSTRDRIGRHLRPAGTPAEQAERSFEAQQHMRQAVRDMLADETKWPKDLIFLGRNLRIVQGNNQFLGSPVNRIKLTGTWASRALVEAPDLSLLDRCRSWGRHLLFRAVMLGTDVVFYVSKARQALGWGGGMEDELEKQMRVVAKDMGVELNHSVFEG